jgi:hypothetical protein
MRRIISVLTLAAVIAMLMAIGATSALAKPSWAPPDNTPAKYGWGANDCWGINGPNPHDCGYHQGQR